jgi:hypothetical protein
MKQKQREKKSVKDRIKRNMLSLNNHLDRLFKRNIKYTNEKKNLN